jgi:hypothetical protein
MSNGTPPIQPAPVPPSIAGIPQPVFSSGSPTLPAAGPITGTPIIPPPPIANPVGYPVFPPTGSNTAPVTVPRGPLVGPAVGPAGVPPSIPGVQQPQFVPPGTALLPATLFPGYTTTTPPSPPIVFANVFKIGTVPPPLPSTPGQTPPPIVYSSVPTIPQLPWNPPPTSPPPVNTVRPVISVITNLEVGSVLGVSAGTWTGNSPFVMSREWTRNGSPIAGAGNTSYTLVTADIGAMIGCVVTATDTKGVEASADALPVGPVIAAPPLDTEQQPTDLPSRRAAPEHHTSHHTTHRAPSKKKR